MKMLDKIYLTNLYRTPHPKAVEYISFSRTHGTLSIMQKMIDNKMSLSTPKRFKSHLVSFPTTMVLS